MRRIKASAPVVALLALLAGAALPATASTPNTGPKPWDASFPEEDGPVASTITGYLKCVVTEIQEDRVIKLWDEKSRTENLVRIAEDVAIRARKKAKFDGRSELEFDDLRPGHKIKLTYRAADGRIVGVKVVGEVDSLPGVEIARVEGAE